MKPNNKRVLAAVVLTVFSIYLTAYTIEAHRVADRYVIELNGGTWWRTTPSGSLFPWPTKPGMAEALSEVKEVDLFIYTCLIRSRVLIVLSVLTWIFAGVCVLNMVKHLRQSSSCGFS